MGSRSPDAAAASRFANRGSGHFDLLLAIFCVVIVLSNIIAVKPIEAGSTEALFGPFQFWPLVFDGGALLFPLAYVLGDVISEVYGFAAARRAVLTGFGLSILTVGVLWLAVLAPAASFWENQEAFAAVLGPVGQIVLASLAGYVTGQLLNAKVLVSMKARSVGRDGSESGLVARLLASTGVGELADTIIFCSIAASAIGITSMSVFANYVVVGVLFKIAVEVLLLPVTVRVIAAVKRSEPDYWA